MVSVSAGGGAVENHRRSPPKIGADRSGVFSHIKATGSDEILLYINWRLRLSAYRPSRPRVMSRGNSSSTATNNIMKSRNPPTGYPLHSWCRHRSHYPGCPSGRILIANLAEYQPLNRLDCSAHLAHL